MLYFVYHIFFFFFRIDRLKGTKENIFKMEKNLKEKVLQPVNGESSSINFSGGSDSDLSEHNGLQQ